MMNVPGAASRTPSPPASPRVLPAEAVRVGGSQRPATLPGGELQALPRAPANASTSMAPRGSRLPATTARAADVPPVKTMSVKEATRQMDALTDAYDALGLKAQQAALPAAQIPLLDQTLDAASKALDFYASLPRDVALRVMPDRDVRHLRDGALHVESRLADLVSPQYAEIDGKLLKALKLLEGMKEANARRDEPLDLTPMVRAANTHQQTAINWWEARAMRAQRMLDIATVAARLPDTHEARSQDEAPYLLRQSGLVLFSNFAALEQRVALVLREIDAGQASDAPAAADDELKHQLVAFRDDIQPAFQSIAGMIFSRQQQSLDAPNRVVLEGVLGRLGEFASSLGDTLNACRATPQGSPAQLEAFDRIIESAWISASKVATTLQVKEPEPQQAPATEARPTRKKDKGKSRAAPSSSTQAARPAAPVAATAAGTQAAGASSSSGKTIVRSALGTPRLVDSAEQAPAAASMAALDLQPSKETLPHHLTRLDEFIGFDLPAQCREVSQAYRELSPESVRFTTEQAVQRLTQQAGEMNASLTVLQDWRELKGLSSSQVPVVHDKVKKLKELHAEVRGTAKALQQGLEGSVMDRMKTYPFPTQAHIEELRKGGQLASVETPRALKGEPGTLFEVKLQPSPLRTGAMPRPIWLHIHTKEPMVADKLATLGDAGFAATHVKSDAERGRNRQWQQARLREGHDTVMIHRGKITPGLCRQLLGA